MAILTALTVGALYAAGLYMMMRRSVVKLIIGLMLLGHATNLLLFTMGRLTRGSPPLVPPGASEPVGPFADPLAQALILTAIVIGFGVQAFAVVLIKRAYLAVGTDDLDEMRGKDTPEEGGASV
jgi:multicomponent Na+:H+ antiporter subunit C